MSLTDDPTMTNMSPEGYIKQGGLVCPVCRGGGIRTVEPPAIVSDEEVLSEVECDECKSRWFDIFALKGYTLIREREQDAEEI
jgi:hypothetical protein